MIYKKNILTGCSENIWSVAGEGGDWARLYSSDESVPISDFQMLAGMYCQFCRKRRKSVNLTLRWHDFVFQFEETSLGSYPHTLPR